MKKFYNLEEVLINKFKPYIDKINYLEFSIKHKDLEIVTLKHAIENLNYEVRKLIFTDKPKLPDKRVLQI